MDRICLTVNGVKCYVGSELSSDVSLLDYLRNYLELRGTKYMCREGGCGACIVSVIKFPGDKPVAVNSCLVTVPSCHNWEIRTVESLGNKRDGYHPIQKSIAEHHGTQCGYCTPGWVMAMYSLLESNKDITMEEIEQSFASNICRCTGYRPILDALKKFGKDSPNPIKIPDIEDMPKCKKDGKRCVKKCNDEDDWCIISKEELPNIMEIDLKDGKIWYKISTLRDLFDIWSKKGVESYMLVAGNTAKGVKPIDEYPSMMIDITRIPELKGYRKDQNLIVNGGTTLTELLDICKQVSEEDDDFTYLKSFYDHLRLVAHIAVRNIATIAGNLMLKHQDNKFGSDIFLLLESIGARITTGQPFGSRTVTKVLTTQQFLQTSMKGKVFMNIVLPPLSSEYKLVTHKIMPRAQNTHAVVNSAILYRLRKPDNIVRQVRIVYSGLNPPYTRATATERYLIGKKLFTDRTLQAAVKILESELVVTENPPEPSAAYRKQLALGLFYKGLLSLCPSEILNKRYKSGAIGIHQTRPVSKGQQKFDTDRSIWPLNQPLQKLEALEQCSGELKYTEDLPSFPKEVFAAFVLSTIAKGTIASIDASKALSHPGVLAFYKAKDIPGLNSFTPNNVPLYTAYEEVLCSGEVMHFNQPVGVIVAETRHLAEKATKLVLITYKNVTKPVTDIREAKKDPNRLTEFTSTEATNKGNDIYKIIKGEQTIYGQYHFPMETLVCVARPWENGLEVHSATQWMDGTQSMIARALKLDVNSVDVYVSRVGGAYGIKISRASQVAVACSLVAWDMNRPCRFIQSLTTNMRAVGKRSPCSVDYEVAVNKQGVIQYINYKMYEDNGYTINETLSLFAGDSYYNVYDVTKWFCTIYDAKTDTCKNTWCRSPGTLEAISLCEAILEDISYALDLDPIKVRLVNIDTTKYKQVIDMYDYLQTKSFYKERKAEVDEFNRSNRWKKRGLKSTCVRWDPAGGMRFDCNISVYHDDGTVALTHSGVEMGQGLNTRAVQICAYMLNIPVKKIKIKANNTMIAPNGTMTGGSIGSQSVSIAVQRACKDLQINMTPITSKMPDATWEEKVKSAYDADIDLQGHGFVNTTDSQKYTVFGVTFSEVEVDILTGQSEVLRVDMIEDAGRPVNPKLDIGQIEGAFVMAMGYWTCEDLVYDSEKGELLTDRTWNYHVAQARDIPQDFRVELLSNSYSTKPILGTKAIGEPPMCMVTSIPFALQEATSSARDDAGINQNPRFLLNGPMTMEKLCLASGTKIEHFKFTS